MKSPDDDVMAWETSDRLSDIFKWMYFKASHCFVVDMRNLKEISQNI